MTRSIRGRLQWWYGAVYALSIVVFGCLVYWRADRDVNERATLQAVSTAQYLDVSLRSMRPGPNREGGPNGDSGPLRDDRPMNPPRDRGGDPFPSDFSLGPLPPEFQFRPPRDRRPGMGQPGDRGPGFQMGPPGRMGPVNLGRPPEPWSQNDEGRPLIDRMEFVVWRIDGSVLARSDGAEADRYPDMKMPTDVDHPPRIMRGNGYIDAAMKGPHETKILVRRPMENDIAKLHQFGFQIAGMAVGTLLVGIVGGWWISGRMVQPIQMISETAAQISAANLDRRIDTRRLDQELVQLASVLNGTFERLETSFDRLTQFTADASHELRTPLAVIQSQMELALSQPRSVESYQQTLETCLRSSERMRSLVAGLLLLARTDSDHAELRWEIIDLRSVVEDAVAQLQDKAVSAGIDLECAAPESAVRVNADIRFLMQVPVNLIDNAIQHTPPGGRIFVEVRIEGAEALLTIRDNGCGISAEHTPHLFERFYRVDTGRSRRHGGSGLGLSICKSLVESHGGCISCESIVGEGATFFVRLPLSSGSMVKNTENKNVS